MTDNNTSSDRPDRTETEVFKANSGERISLCISRVFPNISWRRIKRHLIEANLGFIERVDVIPIFKEDENTGEKKLAYKRAFVHFKEGGWNHENPEAVAALEKLRKGESIRIVYETPWWWVLSVSMSPRPEQAPRPRRQILDVEQK